MVDGCAKWWRQIGAGWSAAIVMRVPERYLLTIVKFSA
jgi:hypothetical protein